MVLLHGVLVVNVIAGKQLEPKKSRFFKRIERGLTASLDGLDPYCSVKLGYSKILQTPVGTNTADPKWNTRGEFPVNHQVDGIELRTKSAKRKGILGIIGKVQHLGFLSISADELRRKGRMEGWYRLGPYVTDKGELDESSEEEVGKDADEGDYGMIHIDFTYIPIEKVVRDQPTALKYSYYPERKGAHVRLYQDAHADIDLLHNNPVNPRYRAGNCWNDIAKYIMEARDFIYICGWSVWTELVLVRDGSEYNGMNIGDMLKQKADQGVTVCVMVWDEVASNRYNEAGLMGTHDEGTIEYFSKTKVHAVKVPRSNDKNGPFADVNDSLMFTHHQKCVITTTGDHGDSSRRRLVAFVGGLDLTNGRYDDPHHSLFRTLKGAHAPPDFWQACATIGEGVGPREGWHDIHSFVTSRSAWDILDNFECRWKRQAPEKMHKALHHKTGHDLVSADEEERMEDGSWSTQILRSINESSAALSSAHVGLVRRKNALVDQSIHNAYCQAIRQAKSFIYIENQYFLGSSHRWFSAHKGGFADHLVPIEIASKICSKIRAREPFYTLVIMPLYPEGPPASAAVQEILAFERKTVGCIVKTIAECIKETGSRGKIEDYFGLYYIGNRESTEGSQAKAPTTDEEKRFAKSRRFMTYIHSKHMIVDDSIAIIGSANINMRSMDGGRDSEIAMMCWQPEHMARGSTGYTDAGERVELPRGDVAAFRANLWKEHLGEWDNAFSDPSSRESVSKLRQMTMRNWEHFAADDISPDDMPHGHLCRYPYNIDDEGHITTLQPNFPDFDDAPIKGKSGALPNILTG